MAVQDFNYKVALASGLRDLQAGRLRQAEQQFGYLCAKFADAPGGYRGLAKVRMEQADRPGALTVLRDGAAKLAKAGKHDGVVALLAEALQLDPLDLAAHRRLAAAYSLAGETDAAASEYARFAHALQLTDPEGARREVRYGLESLGAVAGLRALAAELGMDAGARPDAPTGGARPSEAPQPHDPPRPQAWAPMAPQPPRERVPEPELDAAEDPLAADLRAAEFIAARDPRAAQAALVAARHFIANGHTNAASDLLLQLIASGLADHQAQRLLIDVVRSIGKRDVARAKCTLLAEALRLDGQADLAAEVERLGQAV